MNLPIDKYLIIGSYALGFREAHDIDVLCYRHHIQVETVLIDNFSCYFFFNGWKVECLLADSQESFQHILSNEPAYDHLASYLTLFAIKAGHITFPHKNWEKHIQDYHILKKLTVGNYQTHYVQNLIKLHKKSTQERIGIQRTPKLLGVSKEEFFDDKVVKFIDHDEIHQMVAHREKPMYSYMQRNPENVECDKNLWLKFSYEDQVKCVLEECYVIALERQIIPTMMGKKIGLNFHESFKWALMRVCTTLCSGWFRQFAIENYFEILNSCNKEYFKKIKLPAQVS